LDKHGKLYRIHKRLLYCKNIPQKPQFLASEAIAVAVILLANRSPQWSYGVRSLVLPKVSKQRDWPPDH